MCLLLPWLTSGANPSHTLSPWKETGGLCQQEQEEQHFLCFLPWLAPEISFCNLSLEKGKGTSPWLEREGDIPCVFFPDLPQGTPDQKVTPARCMWDFLLEQESEHSLHLLPWLAPDIIPALKSLPARMEGTALLMLSASMCSRDKFLQSPGGRRWGTSPFLKRKVSSPCAFLLACFSNSFRSEVSPC